MDNRKWYVRCKAGCLAESLTKEQILTAISQALETGEVKDVDTGFVTRLVEQNKGVALYFWVGTQAEYNAIAEKADDCFYIITDDTVKEDIEAAIETITKRVEKAEEKQARQFASLWTGEITVSGIDAEQVKATGKFNEYNLFELVLKDPNNNVKKSIIATRHSSNEISGSLATPNGTYCASITVFPAVNDFVFNYGCRDTNNWYLVEIIGIM